MQKKFLTLAVVIFCTTIFFINGSLFKISVKSDVNIIVAKDGTGNFKTVQAAIDSVPSNNSKKVVIFVKDGIYKEVVTIRKNNIHLIGESKKGTKITYDNYAGKQKSDGTTYGTTNSASFFLYGKDVILENLTIENSFDERDNVSGHQAVAAYIRGDRQIIKNCIFIGNQDTLYTRSGRQYYSKCKIIGDVDFIFGAATAVFDNCEIISTKRGGYITAASTDIGNYGYLFINCNLKSDAAKNSTYLGRPWRPNAYVVYKKCYLGDHIKNSGWTSMSSNKPENARFFEYKNTGPGAVVNSSRRQLSDSEAAKFTTKNLLKGSDNWNPVNYVSNGVQNTQWNDSPVGFASLNGGTKGGAGGETVTVQNQEELERYAGSSSPYIIRIKGKIKISPFGKEVKVKSNKTIIGVGSNATIYQGGFNLNNVKNVIIRNLIIRDTYVEGDYEGKTQDYDAIQVDSSNNIWIDHCKLTHCGDGLIDLRKASSYVTVSWCVFSNHNKAFGIGWTDNNEYKVTIHHNWFNKTRTRNPSFGNGIGHLFNNYILGCTSYGNYSRGYARLVIENSYFKNANNPYFADSTAQLVSKGNILVNCNGKQIAHGSAFNPSNYYSYKLDKAEDIPNLLEKYAGPQSNIHE